MVGLGVGPVRARRLRGAALIGGAGLLLAGVLVANAWPDLARSRPAPAPEPVQVLAASFQGPRDAWVVLKDSAQPNGPTGIYRTADGGRHWTALPVPLAKSYAPLLSFFDLDQGVLVLLRDEAAGRPRLFASGDGGGSWRPLPLPVEAGAAAGVTCFAAPDQGWFLLPRPGGRSQLWRTQDGARSWRQLQPPAMTGGRAALDFVDAVHGLLAAGRLWSTADGGESWRRVGPDLPLAGSLGPAAVAGPELRVAVSWPGGGEVLASHDAGETWTAVGLPEAGDPAGIGLATPDEWYLAAGGFLLVTHDGGGSWTTLRPALPRGAALGQLAMSGGGGWSVGTLGPSASVLLQTADGGHHWQAVALPRVA